MTIDMRAGEPHFVEHLAPIWNALPLSERGIFSVHPSYIHLAGQFGIAATSQIRMGGAALVASRGDHNLMRKVGRSKIARIEHGIGQSYAGDPRSDAAVSESYPGGRGAEDIGLFLVPNEHAGDRWQAAYPNARVRVIGSPKIDTHPPYEPEGEPVIAVSNHFDARVCAETRSAFWHYQRAYVELARKFKVIGHAHPRLGVEAKRFYRKHGIEWVESFREVQRRAAVYICDNSSSLYEFAVLRPVVVLDLPRNGAYGGHDPGYRKDVNHGLRFWEAADVGVRISDPADLVGAVKLALSDPPEQQKRRQVALDIVYTYRDGLAARRAAEALMEWAATPDVRPLPRWKRVA